MLSPGSEWCPSWLPMGPASSSSFAVLRAVYRDTCQRGFRRRGSCSVQISPVPSCLPPHGSLGRNWPIFSYHAPMYSHSHCQELLWQHRTQFGFPFLQENGTLVPWPGHGFVYLYQTTPAGFRVSGEWVNCDASSPANLCENQCPKVLWTLHVISHS